MLRVARVHVITDRQSEQYVLPHVGRTTKDQVMAKKEMIYIPHHLPASHSLNSPFTMKRVGQDQHVGMGVRNKRWKKKHSKVTQGSKSFRVSEVKVIVVCERRIPA